MPLYLRSSEFWGLIWPLVTMPFIFGLIFSGFFINNWRDMRFVLIIGASVGMVGSAVGFLGGNSRTPAVPSLLSAALSLFGVLAVYLADPGNERRAIASSIMILLFAMNMIVASFWGIFTRQYREEYICSAEYKYKQLAALEALRQVLEEDGIKAEIPKTIGLACAGEASEKDGKS
jgi:hypothetical protein